MTEILSELNAGHQVLIPTPDLDNFHKFVAKEKDLYSFRYEYFENETVQITLTGKETIIKLDARYNRANQSDNRS